MQKSDSEALLKKMNLTDVEVASAGLYAMNGSVRLRSCTKGIG